MRRVLTILSMIPLLSWGQQLFVGSNALVHISEGATLEVGGDLANRGVIQNLGTLSLYGNWPVNNNFNGLLGTLKLVGGSNQLISPPSLTMRELIMNQGGVVSFPGDEYEVTDRIEFQFGNIEIGENTRFVLGENARVMGGSNDSYFAGKLIAKGSGIKTYPVGSNGIHAPITLLNVFGLNTEIAASFQAPNPSQPIPSDSVIGVSHRSLWEVELVNGTMDPTQVQLDFNQEDLSDFQVRNNIRNRLSSPIIAYSNDPGGIYGSLGIEEILDSDSLTYGTFISKAGIQPSIGQKIYLALGIAPLIPRDGLYYIPEAFSPSANDPDNQSFRLFGERISEEGFRLEIYNKLGALVYTTTSFAEANKRGWDGLNQKTGAEEAAGIFYFSVQFQFESGIEVLENGAFYLLR